MAKKKAASKKVPSTPVERMIRSYTTRINNLNEKIVQAQQRAAAEVAELKKRATSMIELRNALERGQNPPGILER